MLDLLAAIKTMCFCKVLLVLLLDWNALMSTRKIKHGSETPSQDEHFCQLKFHL